MADDGTQPTGWQPIATAPKDRPVDLSAGRTRFTNCYWSPHHEEWVRQDNNLRPAILQMRFTHWMAIPEPPIQPDPNPPMWARLAELENENRRLRAILRDQTND